MSRRFAALGGLLFGYDTGVISGALIFIKREFGLTTAAEEIVVSGVLLGATIGAIVGGKGADHFGRRRVLLVTAAIFAIGALASAVAPSPAILIASRVVLGLAIGLASTNVPVYLSEVAPPHARGWVVSLFQLAVSFQKRKGARWSRSKPSGEPSADFDRRSVEFPSPELRTIVRLQVEIWRYEAKNFTAQKMFVAG